jgi:uncharacterized protein
MSDESPDIDPTLPEVVQNFLRSGATLQEIRLDERGRWTHEGLQFENPRIERLFSRSVGRTEGGTWVLEIGQFTYPIVVEDTAFFVDRVQWEHSPPLVHLSDETTEELALQSLTYEPGGRLYCAVKQGRFQARFKRSAYHSIMDYLSEDEGQIVLTVADTPIVLGSIEQFEAEE